MDKVKKYYDDMARLAREIEVTDDQNNKYPFSEGVDQFKERAVTTHKNGNKLIFIGNGGSAGISSHMATDYLKNGGLRSVCISDPALLTCISNDYGYEHVYEKPIEMLAQKGDLLVAISSSGKSPNIRNAVTAAQKMGCEVITLSGFAPDNPLRSTGALNFYVPSMAYGFVEILHLTVCHAVLDIYCEEKEN